MLRRVAGITRVLLLLVGLALLVWLPVSFFVYTYLTWSWHLGSSVSSGCVWVWQEKGSNIYDPYPPEIISFDSATDNSLRSALLPAYERGQILTLKDGAREALDVRFPLWLLAAICLAWPVTSLLLARRRRKGRGFEVEVASAE